MDTKHKISIPEPCDKNWDKMIPKDNGRFCLSCTKTVVDFTKMLPEEIQQYFVSNQGKSICGRFKNTQIDNIIIQIPSRVLHSQTYYHKMFLLALFIAMGTTLFSCTDKNGDKQKIDKVEVVKTSKTEHTQVGDIKVSYNSVNPPPPPPPKVDSVKFVNPTNITKEGKAKSNKTDFKKTVVQEESSYITGAIKQTNAEFPGGIDQFYTFFGKEFIKPEQSEVSKIKISFAVEKNGSLTYIQSEPAIDAALEKEIIRVLKACPKWQAGESGGKKIKMQYSLPIALE
ncbi:MAG: hypothetical protein EOO44_01910 [Flavobacterium sp.]|nr:MAG: hypothetical protein EOO44_01910 [Flavobacterium sp.]